MPPFNKGKKKHEFPDAFVIESLIDWVKNDIDGIYVISCDSDFKNACEKQPKLFYLDKLEEFIDIVNKHESSYDKNALDVLNTIDSKIEDLIEDAFNNAGFILTDQNGDVVGTSVKSIVIADKYLVSYRNESAMFEYGVNIEFEAEVVYDDMDTAVYDSEEKMLFPWRTIHKNLEKMIETVIDVQITFNIPMTEITDYSIISFNNGYDVQVSSEDDDYYK